jgi:hypothetical protein
MKSGKNSEKVRRENGNYFVVMPGDKTNHQESQGKDVYRDI